MAPITRWFIKTSFVYLILALLIGVFLGIQSHGFFSIQTINLYPTYIHILVEGWLSMLIIGVAIWMFPKLTVEKPRGNESLSWGSYIFLNLGLLLRMVSEPLASSPETKVSAWAVLLTLAAVFQWIGGMAFVLNAWGRVKVK